MLILGGALTLVGAIFQIVALSEPEQSLFYISSGIWALGVLIWITALVGLIW